MPYCTAEDVRNALSYPASGAPVSDTIIEGFVLDAEEEIENIYHTKFGVVEESGTADGDYSTTTFSDSNLSMTTDQYVGYVVWLTGGVGSGDYREITANTATKFTVSPAFSSTPDGTTTYRVVKLGYKDETVDGSGTNTQFVRFQPLINLNALTVDSTSVTPSYVYQYDNSGKLVVGGTDCEVSYFTDTNPQLVNVLYVYGVYPLPRPMKRLCILIAGIKTLVSQIAGTYDDFSTLSLPGGFSGSKGEPYINIRSAVEQLQREAKNIIENVYRPFTLFG